MITKFCKWWLKRSSNCGVISLGHYGANGTFDLWGTDYAIVQIMERTIEGYYNSMYAAGKGTLDLKGVDHRAYETRNKTKMH